MEQLPSEVHVKAGTVIHEGKHAYFDRHRTPGSPSLRGAGPRDSKSPMSTGDKNNWNLGKHLRLRVF